MQPSDFFETEDNPFWDGADPWNVQARISEVFNAELVNKLRQGPVDQVDDLEAAYALTQLASEELEAYGTDSSNKLDDEQSSLLLRTLRVLLKRQDIEFSPPFRNFTGFRGYWSSQGMSGGGGWAARRGYVNELFTPILGKLEELEDERASVRSVRGVDGELKNLIFASTGYKPQIVVRDAINNIIEVTKYAEYCLFYDRPLSQAGLSWGALADWWRTKNDFADMGDSDVARDLWSRLSDSVKDNPVERLLFRTYSERYSLGNARELPALIPQVYLHYDPLTKRQRDGAPSVLARERMDFLLLLPNGVRVVLEVDGKQHYANGNEASPRLYSEMVAEDRRLRLRGYEVYRFGGYELNTEGAEDMLRKFFDDLLAKAI
ncbi:hypothetical protein [Streptomyces sp. NPDC050548]|uniref:hypothetical protein n=1 Tax=Streptomyces sp. NPDC050548 TaxID=3365629 RepID=UPI0037A46314